MDSDVNVTSKEDTKTVLEALEQGLALHGIHYEIVDSQYGKYIKSIDGEAAGKFGGYDGWLYLVNGSMPAVGIDSCEIKEGDELVFYYGMYPPDTLIPQVEIEPEGAVNTREQLLQGILDGQNDDGGFALAEGEKSDIDITAMALQVLSGYTDRSEVKASVENALTWLADEQLNNGGFRAWENESSESISQVIIALTSLGLDPKDSRFVKKDGDLISRLLQFGTEDGGYSHLYEDNSNTIATEQALLALIAYQRYLNDGGRIYVLSSVKNSPNEADELKDYMDAGSISDWALPYVNKARQLHLMQGTDISKGIFEPKLNISRAEFAALLVRLAGEEPADSAAQEFEDVTAESWYFGYIMKAKEKGFVQGVGKDRFFPNESLSREEMAVMIQRAFDITANTVETEIKDIMNVSNWAKAAILAIYSQDIMTGADGFFYPKECVTREMAATVAVRLYDR